METPQNAAFTITLPLNRDKSKTATYHLKEVDETVYMAARSLMDKDKDFDAVRLMIKSLHVGGDSPDLIKDNFIACRSAVKLFGEILAPVDGELKKN